ncbi:lipopolysaccharide kinase InaA family protein [Patiriisocius hiemis]|uniref:Lipopolysaccharide kinase InaA family protein n=1 Tax=Patiriisocius hiemis TaxID=3075604 RepID=A0ABU2YAC0_9FLAO|nr:lipopolysaccharide kinase InaA family protein [Constantimarinum sp. W242]MDT0555138.1 lipopolysaccharide kinase InaA family protein [Constantimarinum sp. W242]
MSKTLVVHPQQDTITKADVENLIASFHTLEGGINKRNVIKVTQVKNIPLNIKSFKVPHLINKIAYGFFRDSKAKRSFYYAQKLLDKDVKTPEPIAFIENRKGGLLYDSYYVSKHLSYDFTIRELVDDNNFPNYEAIMREFTRFTFSLHEKGINFLDHSPGNTLIIKKDVGHDFYLVDLNRMNFETMGFHKRMKNFARLSPKNAMLELLCDEYAKHYTSQSKEKIKQVMYYYSHKFSSSFKRRERFKEKYFFWRKKRKKA